MMLSKEREWGDSVANTHQLFEPCFVQKVWWEWLKSNPSALSLEKISVFLTFPGAAPEAVEKAFKSVLDSQVVLRFQFIETPFGLRVLAKEAGNIRIRRIDLTHLPAIASAMTASRRFIAKMRQRSLSPGKGKLVDALIIALPNGACLFFANFHHLIFDGFSRGTFSKQLTHLVNAQSRGGTPQTFTRNDYLEWAEQERDFVLGPEGQARMAYWKKWLDDVPALSLPDGGLDLSCEPGTLIGYPFLLSSPITQNAKLLAQTLKVTEFTIWSAICALTLRQWSGQNRFGMKFVGNLRGSKQLSEALGLFTCIDPMEIKLKAREGFPSIVASIKEEYLKSLAFRLPPLPDEFGVGTRGKIPALFNFMPSTETGSQSQSADQLENLWPSSDRIKNQEPLSIPFAAIQLKIWRSKQSLGGQFELNGSLISQNDQKKLLRTFADVVRRVLSFTDKT